MTQLLRTTSEDPDFVALVRLLDADLARRDGEDHAFYAQFNTIASLNHVVVAYREGVACACGAFKPFPEDESGGSVEIKRMFVLPEYRRLGLAALVLGNLEQWAGASGYKRCVLETGKNQPEALALYAKCGYTRIPNYGQYAAIENSVCFSKTLD